MRSHGKKRWVFISFLCLLVVCMVALGAAQADGYDWDVMTSASWENVVQSIGTVTIHEVTKNGANVREYPDANASMAGFVPMGTTYLCLSTAQNGWREILLPTGASGYVSGKLVDFSPNLTNVRTYSIPIGTVSVHSANLRTYAAPTSASDFMGNIFKGNTYPCVDIVGDWYCIAVDHGEDGDWVVYVYNDGIQFAPLN